MARSAMARGAVLVAGLVVFGLAGCQSGGTSGGGGGAKPTGSEFDEGGSASSGSGGAGSSVLNPVYFDYDRYNIRPDARSTLQNNAQTIKSNGNMGTITIEGHCDERGSEEYNLALGERRANGVKQYLVDLGVPASRLRTVSFGEARPAVSGHTEEAWRFNRRSEFKAGR